MPKRPGGWRERKLPSEEYDAMLQANRIGTLSLCSGGQPYAVQLEYLYHEGNLFMATFFEGRKVDVLKKNNRAVFTVFEDRHSHPDMIRKKVRCRSIMAEGTVETVYVKEVTNQRGIVIKWRLLKFTIGEKGSWQCDRTLCNEARKIDNRKLYLEWIEDARRAGVSS